MKIVNPLYDKAFKYLMENEKFAVRILSILLDQDVVEVTFSPQEIHIPNELRHISLLRLDFRAVIREADGSMKTVLVELQKSRHSTDIIRFRNYLAANYRVKKLPDDTMEEPTGGYEPFYPIITIYLLGYSLPDLPYMAVTVDRDVINSVSKEKISAKSFFIEHLTHKAHIIQIGRLPEKRRTKLERFISLFDQQYRSGNDFILDLPAIPEGFTAMVHYLQQPLLDEQFQRALEYEEEVDYWAWEMDNKYQQIIERAEKRTQAAEKKTKAVQKKINALQNQSVEALRLQEEANQQKINLARKLAAIMKKQGIATKIIQAETGLTASEIENCEY